MDQLPEGMRETLYVRDDDWRYSIAFGNYVTLTNIDDNEFNRITRRNASPLYISVHAVDADVRVELMKNKRAGLIKEQMERLAANNITMHTQIVLCPNHNDGEVLIETINYLASLYPHVKSLAVVPVGMTKFRDDLDYLEPVSVEVASDAIDYIEDFNEKFIDEHGESFVFASDEMYSAAQRDFPVYPDVSYSTLLSNGVGMIHQMTEEFDEALEYYEKEISSLKIDKKVLSLTGTSSYDYINMLYNKIKEKAKNINAEVIKVSNQTFGESITVTGLVCGSDILHNLINIHPDVIIVPANMLRDGQDTFLDDTTIHDIAREKKLRHHGAGLGWI